MKIIFSRPELTMQKIEESTDFYDECTSILNMYVSNVYYISTVIQVKQLLAGKAEKDDILIFFTSEKGVYSDQILSLLKKYNNVQSRIWAIAMDSSPECRRPPEPVTDKQSYDVSCRKENRNPLKNNMKAIAQMFARKIVAQTLSPLYQDEVLYFISHRRIDGEHVAGKLADGLRLLTRERNTYRDVVNVAVGDDAQKDIDEHLKVSDVLIFIQTEQAQYSDYIIKELCYALVNDIPVLWIQIDGASYDKLQIHPGQGPILSYRSDEFDDKDRLEEIVDEVEDNCFRLIMNSSNQVYSYVNYLNELGNLGKIKLTNDDSSPLAYEIEYYEKTRDRYDIGLRKHYIQCFGRNPQERDIQRFVEKVKKEHQYDRQDRLFLLSNHGNRDRHVSEDKVVEENYDNYLMNLDNVFGVMRQQRNKRIILSGAFPDCDEIYKVSLLEALVVYSREIIKNGYTLVFGAHPTFQKLIFDIGDLYASDVKYSIEMHMDKTYIDQYNIEELQEKCTLILADGLQKMRENMICNTRGEMLICLGGKIKEDKTQQGVDIEVGLARKANIPVALVGTVGGRSSEYAYQKLIEGSWSDLNPWDKVLNENLFYNVNHRLMIKKLLELIE